MRRKNKISISVLSLNGGGVKIVINLFFVDSGKVLSTLLNLISLPSVKDLFIRKVLKTRCEKYASTKIYLILELNFSKYINTLKLGAKFVRKYGKI